MELTVFLAIACVHLPLSQPWGPGLEVATQLTVKTLLNSLGAGLERWNCYMPPFSHLLSHCWAQQHLHLLGLLAKRLALPQSTGLEATALLPHHMLSPLHLLGTGLEDATPLFVTTQHPRSGV